MNPDDQPDRWTIPMSGALLLGAVLFTVALLGVVVGLGMARVIAETSYRAGQTAHFAETQQRLIDTVGVGMRGVPYREDR